MKRLCTMLLAVLLLLSCSTWAEEYNSFMDDPNNSGFNGQFAWDGEYVYWLHTPVDPAWENQSASLYRMRPGEKEAYLLLEGKAEAQIHGLLNIGDALLLSIEKEGSNGVCTPALLDFDGGNYRELSGNIGGTVRTPDAIYNSVDGCIYRISLKTMKPKRIYRYPEKLLKYNPVLRQYVDGKLYFSTEEHAVYEVNAGGGKAREIARVRGDGFILNGMLYIADYDAGSGTWCYDLSAGTREKISDIIYTFHQGADGFVKASEQKNGNGVIFDFLWLTDSLDGVRMGACDANYDVLLGGRLLRYDWEKNYVDWSDDPLFKNLQ